MDETHAWMSFVGSTAPLLASPLERRCAAALDTHGVEWEHQPSTFVLDVSESGDVRRTARPTFYIPHMHVFLEVVSDSVERTNAAAEAREVRRRYPDVEVLAVCEADVHVLARQWRTRDAGAGSHPGHVSVSA